MTSSVKFVGRFFVLSLLALVLVPSLAHAAAYTWTPTAGGTYQWNDPASNWDIGAYPNANQDVANMNIDLLGNQVVNLNQAIIVGTLNIGDTGGAAYQTTTIQAGTAGSLNLQDTSDNIVDISKAAAGSTVTDVISAPIWLNGSGTLNIANTATAAAGGLTLSGGMHAIGGHYALAKLGAGTVTITGDVNLNPDGSTGAPITVNGGGTLDIAAGTTSCFVNKRSLGSDYITIGGASAGNTLKISGSGQLRSGQFILGRNVAGTGYGFNSAYISSPGTRYNPTTFVGRNSATYTIGGGANSTNNYMEVSNGAWLDGGSDTGNTANIQIGGDSMVAGSAVGATGNQLKVTGAGSTINWGGKMTIGTAAGANSNSLIVQSGGRVLLNGTSGNINVGVGSMNNSATVTGAGSLLQLGGTSVIGNGAGATGNSITVSSGGWLFNSNNNVASLAIGNNVGATGNSLTVIGAGSRMDLAGGLQISSGNLATNNTATIGSGATAYIAGQVSIGGGGGAGQESALNIGDGMGVSVLTINAPNPVALANANSRLNFNNGLLVSNGGGTLASGLGQVTLTGTGSISTPLASTIANVITDGSGGPGGLTKLGAGTLTLSGINLYSGATTANGGTLVLDTATGSLNAASALAVGEGTFQLLGNAAASNQILNGLNVLPGASVVDANDAGGAGTTLDLSGGPGGVAGIARSAGGTVDFTASNGSFGAGGTAIIKTAQPNDGTGILGAWATVLGGTDLAMKDGGNNIVAYAGYANIPLTGGFLVDSTNTNYCLTAVFGGGGDVVIGLPTTNINTLMHNDTATSSTIDTSIGGVPGILRVGVVGGIMINSTSTSAGLTIGNAVDNGTLTAGGNAAGVAGELILGNFGVGVLAVNSTIADNGLGGAVTVTTTGPSEVVLNGTNTYTGGTYLNCKLTLGNTKALGATASTLTINGGTLDSTVATNANNNPLSINGDFTFAGTTSNLNLGTGPATLGTVSGTTRTITVAANTLTLGGSIADGATANSLAKSGTGTLVLSGANAYSGATTINAGVLQAGSTTAFGPATSARLIIPNGATAKVQLNGNDTTVIGLTHGSSINLNAIVENGGSGNATLTVNSKGLYAVAAGLTPTYYGLLQDGGGGTLSLTKTGDGRLDLYNTANTYTGTTTISDGVLYVAMGGLGTKGGPPAPGAADSMGTNHTPAGLVFDGGTLRCAAFGTNSGPDPLTITDRGFTITPGKMASIMVASENGNWYPDGGGAMTFTGGCPATTGGLAMVSDYAGLKLAGTYAYMGDTIINGGQKGWGFFQLGDGTTNGTISSGNIIDNGWLIFNTAPATSQTYAGNIRGLGNLTKRGAGTLALSGTNTYDGMLFPDQSAYSNYSTAVEAGTLWAQKAASLPGQTWSGRIVVASGATLQLSAGGTGEFTGSDLDNVVNNASFASNTATLAVDTSNATAPVLVSANITRVSATNDHAVTKLGAGNLTLSGVNTYTGITTVSGGILQFARQVSLYNNGVAAPWSDTNIIVDSGATLALNVGGAGEFSAADVLTLSGLGTASGGFRDGSSIGLDTTNAGGTFTYSNVIADPNTGLNKLGVAKLGTRTLVLDQANTYTGTTTVTDGTLQLNGVRVSTDPLPDPRAWAPVLDLGGADIQGQGNVGVYSKMVFDYTGGTSPGPTIAGLLKNSYAGGAWNIGQFRNSTAAATGLSLGWTDNPGTNQVTVMATYAGDANLDGEVDGADVDIWKLNVGSSSNPPSGTDVVTWDMADFNYDGEVDGADVDIWKLMVGSSLALPPGGMGLSASIVPEPGTLILLATGLLGLLCYAWRKRK
jgi:autotransporter-associated beta strand protein